ncbi:virulence factor SrfC family protein [Aureimonas psammosilenae]|uniref:virulence factor SrfC family protein n=1 Tax=Aureimonas psammosilenae TaxID=2495496 RepID=UPI0012610271|nr:virulence factor SrfC family protein [Aureimonas psammosilenae]
MTAHGDLGSSARAVGEAARGGLDWLAAPGNRALVGAHGPRVERELRLGAVLARRLADAAERPMAVAVFGASQVGKSHLISVLARKGDALFARFPGMAEPVNYITTINPDRGKEATGLVTRFTVRPSPPGPAGFPVHLRLLGHGDIVKILANAYFFDGMPGRYETWPEREEIEAFLTPFRAEALGATGANGLSVEDVWDLEDYFRKHLGEFELTKRLGSFWHLAAEIAPRLALPRLAEFLSLLWGRHRAITDVYLMLVSGLQRLGFAAEAYAPFAAIDIRTPGAKSILDVEALNDLVDADAPRLTLSTAAGIGADLPRPVVTALTAELVMTLAEKPWDFFERTDLLDFPGYRTRGLPQGGDGEETGGLAAHLAASPRETIAALILRGKVEYLFQRYAAEQEITAMLLCVKESNLDVAQLADVVANWVGTTHGPRPADRVSKVPLLFFVFTRFDLHFEKKTSDSAMGLATRFEGRMLASLLKPFGSGNETWVRRWTPDATFRNSYLMRNPNVMNGEMFAFEGQREIAVRPDRTEWVAALRQGFVEAPGVRDHFADPVLAFDEMMRLNDGGAGHIARNLAPVCDPAVKKRQVSDRLSRLVAGLIQCLRPFYTATDLDKRLLERQAVARRVAEALYHCGEHHGRFGTLLGGLTVDAAIISDRLYESLLATNGRPAESAPTPSPGTPRRRRPWEAEEPEAAPVAVATTPIHSPEMVLAQAAFTEWTERLYVRAADPHFARETGVENDLLRELVDDIVLAARRLDLTERLSDSIRRITFRDRRDEQVAKATLVAERLLNGFLGDLGTSLMPAEARAMNTMAEPERPVFAPRPIAFDADGIGPEPEPHALRFLDDWVCAYLHLSRENALGSDGLKIDPVENARLGAVLSALESSRVGEA